MLPTFTETPPVRKNSHLVYGKAEIYASIPVQSTEKIGMLLEVLSSIPGTTKTKVTRLYQHHRKSTV